MHVGITQFYSIDNDFLFHVQFNLREYSKLI